MSERVYITCVRNIHVLCVCMYTQYVCAYCTYSTCTVCVQESIMCVCVVTYILVILRSSAAVVRASFSSLNSFNNLSLHSSASAQHTHTHPHISHHFRSLTHIHYYIHSHHIKLYIDTVCAILKLRFRVVETAAFQDALQIAVDGNY